MNGKVTNAKKKLKSEGLVDHVRRVLELVDHFHHNSRSCSHSRSRLQSTVQADVAHSNLFASFCVGVNMIYPQAGVHTPCIMHGGLVCMHAVCCLLDPAGCMYMYVKYVNFTFNIVQCTCA